MLELSAEAAVEVQMNAFANNNEPYVDHGIEVAYRFADFDPLTQPHTYFGRNLDLGQFERFRRIFHTQAYRVLLKHEGHTVVSSLQVEERRFKQRVHVRGFRTGEEGTFEFTLVQKLGGLRDGYWYVSSLLADGGGDLWEGKGGQGAPMGWF